MALSRTASLLGAAALATTLAACAYSPVPLAHNFELTTQKKVRSAGHWELVARDVIERTAQTLQQAGVDAGSALHVAAAPGGSTFDSAFRQFLITELVDSGMAVRQAPDSGVEVSYETNLVRHVSRRPDFIPGRYTMLASGVFALHGLAGEHIDLKLAAAVAAGGLADVASSLSSGGPTHTELVLTTTVSSGGQYLARTTDVYYLEDVDASLFVTPKLPAVTVMEVVGE